MTSAVQDNYEVTDSPPTGTALAVRPTAVQSIEEARAAMALRDDEQIMASMMGAVMKEWVYEFPIGGKPIIGISVTGAAEIARLRAEAGFPIRFPVVTADELLQNGRRGLRVTVIARDQRTGGEAPAMVFEPYEDDKGKPNPFPERKALSKARRNAILELIPEQQCLQLIQAAKESAAGRVPRRPTNQTTRREVQARQVEPAPAQAVPVIGGKDPYDLAHEEPKAQERAARQRKATDEQVAIIHRLVTHPAIPSAQREQILEKVDRYNEHAALTCIAALETSIAGPKGGPSTGPQSDDGSLALDDERPTADAVRAGR